MCIQACIQNAAAAAAAAALCVATPAAIVAVAVRHRTPATRGFSSYQESIRYTSTFLLRTNGNTFSKPLGSTFAFVRARPTNSILHVRYGTGVPGTGMDVVPNLPKCPVPVWMPYRTYRSVRYRYGCRTELTEVFGTGIDVVPNLPKCPVPVLMYQTYRSVRYRH